MKCNRGESDRQPLDRGLNTTGGPLGSAYTTRAGNVIYLPLSATSSRPANSRGESRELSIQGRELLAGLFFLFVPLAAALIVVLSAFVYATLIL
jgi:hypothetical protein